MVAQLIPAASRGLPAPPGLLSPREGVAPRRGVSAPSRSWLLTLACGAPALAASLWVAWAGLLGPVGPAAGAEAEPRVARPAPALPLLHAAAETGVAEMLIEKPLFSPSRARAPKAPVLAAQTIEAPPPPPPSRTVPSYTMGGVLISASGRKVLLRRHKGDRGWWIGEGKTTSDGWKVLTVTAENVNLSCDGQEVLLFLRPHR
ncbi:hypothetical protein [Methylobacterium segetis]|uniref:hypothetical protein n=1 Tax=Methylobacterium segetis TaxID=2488750 RepID=UPI001043EC4C|nr:hypothetical protein [Methylobacterium segetis]